MLAALRLTEEQVLAIHHQLAKEYKKAEFQLRLHAAWAKSGGVKVHQRSAVREACWSVQLPLMLRYGFEESGSGLQDFTSSLTAAPQTAELETLRSTISWLLNPEHQEDWPDFVPDAELPKPEHGQLRPDDLRARGSRWLVTGGPQGRGLLVRKGEALDSAAFPFRLQKGAQLRALDAVEGNRLHYRRLSGDGPDFGWISIEANGNTLVKPDLDGIAMDKLYGTTAHQCNPVQQRFVGRSRKLPSVSSSLKGTQHIFLI